MKQLQLTVIAVLFSFNMYAITHTKTIDPVIISINLPKEQVWQRLLDLLVANNVPLKFADKNSGLIQSERVGLGSHYALSNADDSTAWALCETVILPVGDSFYMYPQIIHTELQVYVRETADGTVLLSVNLMNLTASYTHRVLDIDRNLAIESTKRLENLIGNYLKSYQPMPNLAFDPPLAVFGETPSQTNRRMVLLQKINEEHHKKQNEEKEKHERLSPLYVLGGLVLGFFYLLGKIREQ
jgi:hypothetical protein